MSNQIVLGTSAETVKIPGVVQYSVTYIYSNITLSAPFSNYYVTTGTNIRVNLPEPVYAYGFVFVFKRMSTGDLTITTESGAYYFVGTHSVTAANGLHTSGDTTIISFFCDGNLWYQTQ